MNILVLNVGSSSVKFQLVRTDEQRLATNTDERLAGGQIERIGGEAVFAFRAGTAGTVKGTASLRDHRAAVEYVLAWMTSEASGVPIGSVGEIDSAGHRVAPTSPPRRAPRSRVGAGRKESGTLWDLPWRAGRRRPRGAGFRIWSVGVPHGVGNDGLIWSGSSKYNTLVWLVSPAAGESPRCRTGRVPLRCYTPGARAQQVKWKAESQRLSPSTAGQEERWRNMRLQARTTAIFGERIGRGPKAPDAGANFAVGARGMKSSDDGTSTASPNSHSGGECAKHPSAS
jgi:hypothetical protein